MIAVWALYAWVVACQPNKDARPNPEPAKQEQPALPSTNGEQGQAKATNNKGKPNDISQGRDTSFKWPQCTGDSNWWLVIIAAITGGVIGWQGWQTRKAAQAGEISANSALAQIPLMKDSLEAIQQQANIMEAQVTLTSRHLDWLIEKERPRLSIELDRFDPRTDDFTGEYCVTGVVSIYGHTIARIKKAEICVSTERHVLESAFETPIQGITYAFRSWSPDEIELPRTIHPNSHDTRFIATVYSEPRKAASAADISAALERYKPKSSLRGESFNAKGLWVSPVPKVLNSYALYCRARIEYFFGNSSWIEDVEMKFLVFDDTKVTSNYGWWEYHYIEEQDNADNPS